MKCQFIYLLLNSTTTQYSKRLYRFHTPASGANLQIYFPDISGISLYFMKLSGEKLMVSSLVIFLNTLYQSP